MKVNLIEDFHFGRKKTPRTGVIIGIYPSFALVRILDKYNSAFFYYQLSEAEPSRVPDISRINNM